MSSRWSSSGAALGAALVLVLILACGGEGQTRGEPARDPGGDAAQREAETLGREVAALMDRVLAYRSSHRGQLPPSLRQAGLDSLTPDYIRRLTRQGSDPVVTILFRRTDGRTVLSCAGNSVVLEDAMLRDGRFEVTCVLASGGSRTFRVTPG